LLSAKLADVRSQFAALYDQAIPAFNDAQRAKGSPSLLSVREPAQARPAESAEEPDDEES
jgi:hypothetical protein